ncbi:MAG: type II toxin-antitoxin system Phd/YefM family antitoxin [Betaproteobacteria bacterium]|nr:type II toxin-antitoxin system Phd/YefM family antitoxin [Betaproteobacteria bacterium]
METIGANERNTQGVSALEAALENRDHVAITVRGKSRFVVMDIEECQHLREEELLAAWHQARADAASGRSRPVSATQHFAEAERLVANHAPAPSRGAAWKS